MTLSQDPALLAAQHQVIAAWAAVAVAFVVGILAAAGGFAAAWASFRAARVALQIAEEEKIWRREEEIARGRVIASYLFTDVGGIQKHCEEAIKRLDKVQTFADERAMECLDNARQIVASIDVTKIEQNLEKLIWLPIGYAAALTAMPDMKKVVLVVMRINETTFPLPIHAHEAAGRGKTQLAIMLSRVTEFINEYMPLFATPVLGIKS